MKSKFLTILIGLGLSFGAFAQNSTDTIQISLSQAVDIALSKNPTIKINDKEITRTEYARRETYGQLLPTLSVSASYSRAIKKQRMFISIPGMASDPNGIEVGQDNTFNGSTSGFVASLPIIAPTLWASLKMSETDMEAALEKAQASKIDLENQVTKAYFAVLMSQDSYKVIQKTYANALENSRIISDKYKQGTVAEFESIRANVQVKNVEANLAATENAVELAKLQLKLLMGVDMDLPIKSEGSLSDYQKDIYTDYFKLDATDYSNNTDMKQFDISAKKLKQGMDVQKAQWWPTLSASFNYNIMSYANDSILFTKTQTWFPMSNFALVLNLPLFQGGQRYYKQKSLALQIDELKDQKSNLKRSIQLQGMSYINNMEKAIKLIESNQEAMKQSEKAMTIAEKRYAVGAGTYLDVTDAQLSYMQSGFAYNQSIYDYLTAKADLDKLMGK